MVENRIIRNPKVLHMTGLSRVTIWRLEQQGKFPKRRQLGPNSVGWLLSEVEDWIKSRLEGGKSNFDISPPN